MQVYLIPPPKPPPPTEGTTTGPKTGPAGRRRSRRCGRRPRSQPAGGTPVIVKQFDVVEAGHGHRPTPPQVSPVQQAQTVQLVVSAGYPHIVFSDGKTSCS